MRKALIIIAIALIGVAIILILVMLFYDVKSVPGNNSRFIMISKRSIEMKELENREAIKTDSGGCPQTEREIRYAPPNSRTIRESEEKECQN